MESTETVNEIAKTLKELEVALENLATFMILGYLPKEKTPSKRQG